MAERRRCPKEFQDRLTDAVGLNRYGEPNFLIEWGQTRTYQAGGVWEHDGVKGYRELMLSNSSLHNGVPCWMILEWHPPEDYGPFAYYYHHNRDEWGYQTLGEYPWRGRYEVALKLTSTELRSGRLDIVHYHLDGMILDALIPVILEARKMTIRERLRKMREWDEKKDKNLETKVDALYHDSKRKLTEKKINERARLIQQQMGIYLKHFGRPQSGMKLNSPLA